MNDMCTFKILLIKKIYVIKKRLPGCYMFEDTF